MLRWAFAIIGLVIGISGFAYGADQKEKRKQERAIYQKRLAELETELKYLEERYGKRSEQVIKLLKEIERLQKLICEYA